MSEPWIVTLEDARDGESITETVEDSPEYAMQCMRAVVEQLGPMFEDKRAGLEKFVAELDEDEADTVLVRTSEYIEANYDDIYLHVSQAMMHYGPEAVPHATAIKSFLRHSWDDIEFEYDGLTEREQDCMSRQQFADLVKWVRG